MQVIVISWIQFTMHQSRYRSPEESSDLLPARCKETYFVIAQVPHVLGSSNASRCSIYPIDAIYDTQSLAGSTTTDPEDNPKQVPCEDSVPR